MSSNVSYVDVSHPRDTTIPRDMTILSDLTILCLLPAVGLALTALVFALGFGEQVTEALGLLG